VGGTAALVEAAPTLAQAERTMSRDLEEELAVASGVSELIFGKAA